MSHTMIERVESNSVSPSKPVSKESQNRRSAVIEDSSKHSSSPKPSRAKKCPKNVIKLDEKSNMGKLADQILPQLNHMQKNFLGLLFFNELSSNIVDDMVAQQLSMMSANKLASVMGNVDQEVSFRKSKRLLQVLKYISKLGSCTVKERKYKRQSSGLSVVLCLLTRPECQQLRIVKVTSEANVKSAVTMGNKKICFR